MLQSALCWNDMFIFTPYYKGFHTRCLVIKESCDFLKYIRFFFLTPVNLTPLTKFFVCFLNYVSQVSRMSLYLTE